MINIKLILESFFSFNLHHCADLVCIFSISIDSSSDGPLWPQTFRVNIYWTTVMRLENKNVLRQTEDLLFSLFCIFCSLHFVFCLYCNRLTIVCVCWKKINWCNLLCSLKWNTWNQFIILHSFSFSLCSLFQISLKGRLELL